MYGFMRLNWLAQTCWQLERNVMGKLSTILPLDERQQPIPSTMNSAPKASLVIKALPYEHNNQKAFFSFVK